MKKIKFLFIAIVSLILVSSAFLGINAMVAKATYTSPINDGVFGQNQYYSVVYDGEGEAAVAAKLQIQNNGKEDITSTVIEVPGVGVRMIKVVQEVYSKEKYCADWGVQKCAKENDNGKCLEYSQKCNLWRLNYKTWDPIYYTLSADAEELSNSVKYTINLSKPIKEQEQSALILYYKSSNMATKSGGVFSFKFETPKVEYDVNYVRVAINTQEGLYLKGVQAQTNYRPNQYEMTMKTIAPSETGVKNQALKNISNQISYMNGYVKSTSGLDPWESFVVEGKYAKSKFALYRGKILGWTFGIIVFFAVLGVLIRWIIKRSRNKIISKTGNKSYQAELLPLKIIGTGIATTIILIILIILSSLLMQVITRNVDYQYQSIINLLIVLLDGILVLVGVFGPPLYFGLKYGVAKGIWTLAVIIISFLILGIITILIYMIIHGGMRRVYY